MIREIGSVRLHDVESIAQLFGVTETTVRTYIRKGKLQGRRIGKRYYVAESELERFVLETGAGQDAAD